MTTSEIANKLVLLLREAKFEEVYDTLFDAEKVRHVEPQSEHFADITGVNAIKEKDTIMGENIQEVNSLEVGTATVSKDHIALPYKMTFTMKDGNAVALDEIIVYEVQDGKIVLEQFFY